MKMLVAIHYSACDNHIFKKEVTDMLADSYFFMGMEDGRCYERGVIEKDNLHELMMKLNFNKSDTSKRFVELFEIEPC